VKPDAFWTIVRTELRLGLRRPATWIVGGVFLLLAWLLAIGHLNVTGASASGTQLAINSDYMIAVILGFFALLLMHFTATLCATPIVRDMQRGVAGLVGATPLPRGTWLLAKFAGGWLVTLCMYGLFVAALVLSQLVSDGDVTTLPFRLLPYLKHAFAFVVVSTFFVGSLAFASAARTGSMKPAFVLVTVLFVAWFATLNLTGDAAWRFLAACEPSGVLWLRERVAKSRGNAWLNAHTIAFDTAFWLNRIGLVAIGTVVLLRAKKRFEGLELGTFESADPEYLQRVWGWFRRRDAKLPERYTQSSGPEELPVPASLDAGPGVLPSRLRASIATELRLLTHERSLWIMVPLIMTLAGVWAYTFVGPFRLPVYPVSSEFAQQMVGDLLLLLAGTVIFYTGEAFHRDETHRVRAILYASPVSNATLLLGKYVAMVVLAVGMTLATFAAGIVSQLVRWELIDGRTYVELGPYVDVGLRILLPSILILVAIALTVNVLVRGKAIAYFASITISVGYVWLLLDGERSLLVNPLMIGHWAYSDLTGLEPFTERLWRHHAFWGSVLLASFGLATWLLARRRGRLGQYLSRGCVQRHAGAFAALLLGVAGAVGSGLELRAQETVRGSERELEERAVALEREYGDLLEAPRVGYDEVELDVRFRTSQHALDVRGDVRLVNPSPEPIETLLFTIDELFEVRRFDVDGGGPLERVLGGLVRVPLDAPLLPGEHTRLEFEWSGRVEPGIPAQGGPQNQFVHERAVMVHSYSPCLVPQPGLSYDLLLQDDDRRSRLGLGEFMPLRDRHGDAFVPSLFGSDVPFRLDLSIDVPVGLVAVSGGVLVGRRELGDREQFQWRTDRPVRAFTIVCGDYDVREQGDDAVWFHPDHRYNLDTVLEALADARRLYDEAFGPYPHRTLRIVEFPRLASFAQSFPTTMPYSESIGFLTNHHDQARLVDATYFVTAHEVAHQWWGYVVHPGASLGAQVLSESLAEYSALLLLKETRGEREELVFLKQEEDRYLRARDPDEERPLAELAFEGQYVWYHKGAFVFHMLEAEIGRARLVGALRAFADRFRYDSGVRSHATLGDLLDELRAACPDHDLEAFIEYWFESVAVPDMTVLTATAEEHGDGWLVRGTATNLEEGRLAVEIEAVRGRFDLETNDDDWNAGFQASPAQRIRLEPGVETAFEIRCDFEPERVVIDRRFRCLDFDRTNNRAPVERVDAPATATATTTS